MAEADRGVRRPVPLLVVTNPMRDRAGDKRGVRTLLLMTWVGTGATIGGSGSPADRPHRQPGRSDCHGGGRRSAFRWEDAWSCRSITAATIRRGISLYRTHAPPHGGTNAGQLLVETVAGLELDESGGPTRLSRQMKTRPPRRRLTPPKGWRHEYVKPSS